MHNIVQLLPNLCAGPLPLTLSLHQRICTMHVETGASCFGTEIDEVIPTVEKITSLPILLL